MRNADHCVINTFSQEQECHHCGKTDPFILPMPSAMVSLTAKDFIKKHVRCKPSLEGNALKLKAKEAWEKHLREKKMKADPSRHIYRAVVDRVVDGDTLDCTVFLEREVSLGFHLKALVPAPSISERFRLSGIDTPELRSKDSAEKAKGLAAKEFVIQELEKHESRIILVSYKMGSFRRWLADIYPGWGDYKEDAVSLNDMLIKEGHAKPYRKK